MNISELKELQNRIRNIYIKYISIPVILGVILKALIIEISLSSIIIIIFEMILITLFIAAVKTKELRKKYKEEFKRIFVPKTLQIVFDDLEYHPDKGLDESLIANTDLISKWSKYASNDLISGKYKNVNVTLADINISKIEGDDTIQIFKGRWMIFDFNKKFKANIQVRQRNFKKVKTKNKKYKEIITEDQDFNNKFITYAQDEHDAFYVLTPSFINKIKNLDKNISGSILLCFIDNKLHVGIDNHNDSLEHAHIFEKINEQQIANKILKDIKLITTFIDELNLDNDLFKKEV